MPIYNKMKKNMSLRTILIHNNFLNSYRCMYSYVICYKLTNIFGILVKSINAIKTKQKRKV